eukprot:718913-Prorocentrum_minimum.AAC.2
MSLRRLSATSVITSDPKGGVGSSPESARSVNPFGVPSSGRGHRATFVCNLACDIFGHVPRLDQWDARAFARTGDTERVDATGGFRGASHPSPD